MPHLCVDADARPLAGSEPLEAAAKLFPHLVVLAEAADEFSAAAMRWYEPRELALRLYRNLALFCELHG